MAASDGALVQASSSQALGMGGDAARVGWASFNSVSAGLAGLALAGPVGSAWECIPGFPCGRHRHSSHRVQQGAFGISSWILSSSDAAASGAVAVAHLHLWTSKITLSMTSAFSFKGPQDLLAANSGHGRGYLRCWRACPLGSCWCRWGWHDPFSERPHCPTGAAVL